MKTFGWICIVLGGLSFIGAASAGHNVFGPVFWLALGIALVYFGNQKEEEKKKKEAAQTPKPQQPVRVEPQPVQVAEPVKQKTYWENYKETNPNKAKEIEDLLSIDMSNMSDRDVREKIQMLDRFSKSLNCSIPQMKTTYLREMEKYPARLIPQMIETTKKEMANEVNMFHISESNTCSALMIEWLKERQQNAPKDESYWESWKRDNPEKAKALTELTKLDFDDMDDEDVMQLTESFKRMADANGLSDWNQIKDNFLNKFKEMAKDLCDEEALNVFDNLISQESDFAKVDFRNTASFYAKQWYEEFIKSKNTEPLTPEEAFRKEYRGKLIKKIGTNANIPLFCEGYDSPIAHEIMYLMYQHLRNGELKTEAESQGLWNKYMQIIVDETEKVTERYCHASLQECIEYYNFPDKKVVTRDRCPNCGSRHVTDDFDFGLECMDCGSTWNAPLGKNLYL
jgi:ribosomal protein S27AE